MLPIVDKSNIYKAKYTKTLYDIGPSNLQILQTLFNTFGHTGDLYTHFTCKYMYYEICDTEVGAFIEAVRYVFNERKDYYTKLLESYTKDIDIDDITSKSSSRTDTNTGSQTETGSSSSNGVTKEYDLPHNSVTPSSEDGYLTGKRKNENTGSATDSKTHNNTYVSSNESYDNREFIRLKNEYLAHIRDIYEEFTDEFEDCFLHVY